jgi:hypothetical protein
MYASLASYTKNAHCEKLIRDFVAADMKEREIMDYVDTGQKSCKSRIWWTQTR